VKPMPPAFRRLLQDRKGAALVEFAVSAFLMISVLVTSVEFGVEMFIRQSVERAASAASLHYAETRSIEATQARVDEVVPVMLKRCLETVRVRLYDQVQGTDLRDEAAGRWADGSAADESATLARVELTCRWQRITPVVRASLGPEMLHRASIYTRMRD